MNSLAHHARGGWRWSMSADVVVELSRISKSFPGVAALQGVDLALRAGAVHALVGENGAGKSTLINILSGVLTPDAGEVRLRGEAVHFGDARAARRRGVVTVHQEVDLFPDLSVAENIGLEQGLPTRPLGWIDWKALRTRTREAVRTVGEDLPLDAPASVLSPAQRQMVEIAAAVSEAARVLILDEPTSSLSAAETEVLFGHLRRFRAQGTAVVYVSHRLEEIFRLADDVTVLRDGRHVWSGPVSASSPQHLIGLMVGRAVTAGGRPEGPAPGPVLLSCQGLTAADHSFADVSLEVRAGEVLGLYGLIGAGRSEWAQAVFGLRPLAGGEVRLQGRPVTPHGPGPMVRRRVAYLPEDRLRQGLCRGLSVRANVVLAALRRLARGLWVPRREEERRTRSAVDQLAIRLRSADQPAGTLSGGNQQKVILGRWLGCEPQVLILDEPTRGVDVGAKAEIHALIHRLAAEGRAVILISSDLPEVLGQSDRVGVFREGRLAATLDSRQTSAEEVAALAIPQEEGVSTKDTKDTKKEVSSDSVSFFRVFRVFRGFSPALRETGLLLILLALFGYLEWRTGAFLEAGNLRNLATATALLSFCAVGATLVILAGGIDISLGALLVLSEGVAGSLWHEGWPFAGAAAMAMLVGGLGGFLNAGLSLVGRVHPIVVTLGTMSLYRGLAIWWIAEDVQVPNEARSWLFAPLAGVPVVVWSGLGVTLLAWLFLQRTVAGREVYALGSNPTAARRVGIHPGRVWLLAFTLQGMLAGLAGLLYLADSGSLQPAGSEDRTLDAIAAAVVGGVAITGGRGSVWGALVGGLFLLSLPTACIFLHVPAYWQRTLIGGVMVVAIVFDCLWRRGGR
jgi:ABC-type sugar transport system ATPase subunit/ribose/xylose/arabinose/galactoside ABC-type transport system permease subunit